MLSWQVWPDPILILSAKFCYLRKLVVLEVLFISQWHSLPSKGWVSAFDANLFSYMADCIQKSCSRLNRFIERVTWINAYLYFSSAQILFCLTWIVLYEVFINLGTTARHRQKINILTLTCAARFKKSRLFVNYCKVFWQRKALSGILQFYKGISK